MSLDHLIGKIANADAPSVALDMEIHSEAVEVSMVNVGGGICFSPLLPVLQLFGPQYTHNETSAFSLFDAVCQGRGLVTSNVMPEGQVLHSATITDKSTYVNEDDPIIISYFEHKVRPMAICGAVLMAIAYQKKGSPMNHEQQRQADIELARMQATHETEKKRGDPGWSFLQYFRSVGVAVSRLFQIET